MPRSSAPEHASTPIVQPSTIMARVRKDLALERRASGVVAASGAVSRSVTIGLISNLGATLSHLELEREFAVNFWAIWATHTPGSGWDPGGFRGDSGLDQITLGSSRDHLCASAGERRCTVRAMKAAAGMEATLGRVSLRMARSLELSEVLGENHARSRARSRGRDGEDLARPGGGARLPRVSPRAPGLSERLDGSHGKVPIGALKNRSDRGDPHARVQEQRRPPR